MQVYVVEGQQYDSICCNGWISSLSADFVLLPLI
nr:MAG TPA: Fibrillin 1 unique N-terminal domain [Caudoviricetes sp.]